MFLVSEVPTPQTPHPTPRALSSDDVFQETSARYRAVKPSSGSTTAAGGAAPIKHSCALYIKHRHPESPQPRHLSQQGASLIRNTPLLGPCSRPTPRVLWFSWGGGLFLMSELPL